MALDLALARPWTAWRARQWLHFLALPLAGVTAHTPLWRLAAAVIGGALALAYAYGLNSISDRATDLDRAKNPLAGVDVCPPAVLLGVVAVGVGALAATLPCGPWAQLAMGLSLVCSTVYSIGPRLKCWPVAGTLLNVAMFAPLLFLAVADRWPRAFVVEAALFALLLLQNQLLHERADADEDADAGARTTAQLLDDRGLRATIQALGLLALLALLMLAPSLPAALCGALAALAATIGALAGRAGWRARRLRHRRIAFAGGALLFVAGWLS